MPLHLRPFRFCQADRGGGGRGVDCGAGGGEKEGEEMSIGTPFVVIDCDDCGAETETELGGLAGRDSWTTRHVVRSLQKEGWIVDDGKTICPDCQDEDD